MWRHVYVTYMTQMYVTYMTQMWRGDTHGTDVCVMCVNNVALTYMTQTHTCVKHIHDTDVALWPTWHRCLCRVCHLWMSHGANGNESRHIFESDTSQIWTNHIAHTNDSCHTRKCVISHMHVMSYIQMSHVAHTSTIPCHVTGCHITRTSHVTRINESCHTHINESWHTHKHHTCHAVEEYCAASLQNEDTTLFDIHAHIYVSIIPAAYLYVSIHIDECRVALMNASSHTYVNDSCHTYVSTTPVTRSKSVV